MKNKKNIELLSPAGSYESLVAAANAGCDAVYIGGTLFGARAFAENLQEDLLLRAIDYIHVRDKKIYLTVNTLLKTKELEEKLYDYLLPYYVKGIDAVIVQDIGVIRFIHRNFKGLPIHASTQMTLTMAEGAEVLKPFSVTRLVTARELSLEEIKAVKSNTSLEIESFVHGALCYSYSGQCLMSSMIGGRSGNRGRCAQPCRMLYKADKTEGYLLSPKDMCTLTIIPELIEAGIDSFKIEGRMKRYEYTAGVTRVYRKHIDLYESLGKDDYTIYCKKHKDEILNELTELKDLYNRGDFCSGYYKMHNGRAMMSIKRPNHSGVYVGNVVNKTGISMEIELMEKVNPKDILDIRTDEESIYEFTLKEGMDAGERLNANFKPGSSIKIGSRVYRVKNNSLLENISKKYYNEEVKQNICGNFYAKEGEEISLTANKKLSDGTVVSVTVFGNIAQKALKQPVTEEKIYNQLVKTMDTPFSFDELSIELYGDIFLPLSNINELRREALLCLENTLAIRYERRIEEKPEEIDKDCSVLNDNKERRNLFNPDICASVINMEQLKEVLRVKEVNEIYFDITDIDFKDIELIADMVKKSEKTLFLMFPHIFRKDTYNIYKDNIKYLTLKEIAGYIIRNFEEYYFLSIENKEQFINKEIRSDYMLYAMNKESKLFLKELNITCMTAPMELNYKELLQLNVSDMELIYYGRIPLMVSAQCIKKNLKSCSRFKNDGNITMYDRMNKELKVFTHCNYCYNTIYNSDIYALFECMNEIKVLNPKSIRLSFTTESKDETRKILNISHDILIEGKQASFISGYTKGHFKRGCI